MTRGEGCRRVLGRATRLSVGSCDPYPWGKLGLVTDGFKQQVDRHGPAHSARPAEEDGASQIGAGEERGDGALWPRTSVLQGLPGSGSGEMLLEQKPSSEPQAGRGLFQVVKASGA